MSYRIYFSKCKADLPIIIHYTCPYCGHINNCSDTIHVEAMSNGSFGGLSEYQEIQAKNMSMNKFSTIINNVSKKDFRDTSLRCYCEECTRRPPWALYPNKENSVILFIVGIMLFVSTIVMFIALRIPFILILLVLSLVLMLPFVDFVFSRKKRNKMISVLQENQLPYITIDTGKSRNKKEIDTVSGQTDQLEEHKKTFSQDKIRCAKCGTIQNKGRKVCWGCGARFVDEDGNVEEAYTGEEALEEKDIDNEQDIFDSVDQVVNMELEQSEQSTSDDESKEDELTPSDSNKEKTIEIEDDETLEVETHEDDVLYCRYCGFKLLDNSEYCSHCGKKVL